MKHPNYSIIFQTIKYGFSKLWNFGNSVIIQIEQFQRFNHFSNQSITEIFGNIQIGIFFNFCNWKIEKYPEFYNMEN